MKFQGKAFKDGSYWLADIPFLELMTQGRTKKRITPDGRRSVCYV